MNQFMKVSHDCFNCIHVVARQVLAQTFFSKGKSIGTVLFYFAAYHKHNNINCIIMELLV